MTDRWAVNIIEALRENRNGAANGSIGILEATVNTAKPITLKMNNQIVSKNIYIPPSMLVLADDSVDKVEEAFIGAPGPQPLFDFLKEFHQKSVLKKGDTVVVVQAGFSFYILQKVVAV